MAVNAAMSWIASAVHEKPFYRLLTRYIVTHRVVRSATAAKRTEQT
jgi:hypothetical protein